MRGQLRPVGDKTAVWPKSNARLAYPLDSPHCLFLASGTAALASAIKLALKRSPCEKPEVIIPAYGCPDLVSAAVFAGATPVLVDLIPDSPRMDTEQLSAAINANTRAIIAASFLGIRENFVGLRKVRGERPISIIEDSAQWFPYQYDQKMEGDLAIFSFGRGKPNSMLKGGALLCASLQEKEDLDRELVPLPYQPLRSAVKRLAYNTLIQPGFYKLISQLPFLQLGATQYKPLESVRSLDNRELPILATNIEQFKQTEQLKRQEKLSNALEQLNLIDLPKTFGINQSHALLRYPVLVDSHRKDEIHEEMNRCGLGSSVMYAKPLAAIEGVESRAMQHGTPKEAANFSARLLTLPTHSDLGDAEITAIKRILEKRL